MINWYKSKKLEILFSDVPCVSIRYILPTHTEDEKKSIKKYPFICRRELFVKLINYQKNRVFEFCIPKGYCYDGASIPRMFWRLIGSNTDNTFLIPALIHDYLCENHGLIDNDRDFSSNVFNALLEVSEVSNVKRYLMKHSVNFYQRFCHWKGENK